MDKKRFGRKRVKLVAKHARCPLVPDTHGITFKASHKDILREKACTIL